MRTRALVSWCLSLVLAACATGPRPVPDDPDSAWQEARTRLSTLERWQAKGRLAVRTPDDGGQAHFAWHEFGGDRFELRLAGPWGQGAARLLVTGGRAVLEAADDRRFAGPDARDLLLAVYGWDIPVDALRRWLVGLPTAGAEYRLDRFGRIAALEWRGWALEYRRYRQRDGLDLPAVLVAHQGRGRIELRVAVDTWHLGAGDEPVPESPVPLIGG